MNLLSRVVWSEGMHLAQHHFQAQARYFEELASFVFSSLYYKPYGLAGLELDAEALLNGTVALTHARGVMPDGTPFHFPDEPPPLAMSVREIFSATHDSHRVLLALPEYRADRANCRLDSTDGGEDPRYIAATTVMPDETTGQAARPLSVGRKNFRMLLDNQPVAGLVTMPIAQIRRDGSGHYIYDAAYVPPCTQIGASRQLLEQLTRLIALLESKADSLAEERRRSADPADYATREIAGFWLSHAVHTSLGSLRYLRETRGAHPERLYCELARLAGALSTFSLEGDPRQLPLYDHDDATTSFDQLDRLIRRYLEAVMPSNSLSVPLTVDQPNFYRGTITDRRALGQARWFLGVRSSIGHGAVIESVPRLVKICSAEHIVKLVQRAYPGLVLEHVQVPPSAISPRVGMQYFAIQTNPAANTPGEPCWRLIADTAQVGVYVPSAIPDVELDLSIVLES